MTKFFKFSALQDPNKIGKWKGIGILPFLLLIAVYFQASHKRLSENEQDKLLPSLTQMVAGINLMAFTEDKRTGDYLFWKDTSTSLLRLFIGVLLAALTGFLLGLTSGLYSHLRFFFMPFITFVSIVPPLSILPILFVALGVDEVAKISLIFLGTFPLITRDIYLAAKSFPLELLTKAMTLGGSKFDITFKVVLSYLTPRLIETVRLSLGGAWLFLIAAEAIASTDGLGYRIFLVRRYLAMDIIIPYVLWITFLGFLFDWLLQKVIHWRYPWHQN